MPTLNKKGQSLIEVVVALGILAFVFAGTVTLIVQIVSLELSARNRTEAMALAQKKLAETVSAVDAGCSGSTLPVDQLNVPYDIGSTSFRYDVDVNDASAYTSDGKDVGLNQDAFAEINITIRWDDRDFSGNEYKLKQIVKK